MKEPLVSIILSNYNGLMHLKEVLVSLTKVNYNNIEIILIDNNSKDNSVNYVRNNYPSIKLIQNEKDFGFSGANTIAATYAHGKYLAFLNIDTIVSPNWLNELIKIAESSNQIGIVVSKILSYYNRNIIDYAGGICDRYLQTGHIGNLKREHKLLDIQRETFYACFASAIIRTKVYKEIGLFDPYYYAYFDDVDLSWRTWLMGYKVIYAPKSIIYHKIGKIIGTNELSFRKRFLGEKNRLRTLLKNYELKTVYKILPFYIKRRIGVILRQAVKLNNFAIIYLFSNVRAFFWNIIHFKSLLKERKFIQFNRKKDDKFIFRLMDKSVRLANLINN